MQKTWVRLAAAFAALLAVFALCLRLGRGGLTLYFEVPPEATEVSVRFEPEGIVREAESRVSPDGSELAVHFEPVSRGTTQATVCWEGVGPDSFYDKEIQMELRSLPLGILTDSITWNFTGWGYLTACVSAFLLAAALILVADARRERRRACFSYRATGELGLAIFLLISGLI